MQAQPAPWLKLVSRTISCDVNADSSFAVVVPYVESEPLVGEILRYHYAPDSAIVYTDSDPAKLVR